MAPLRPLRLRLGVFVERVHALVQEHRQPLDVVARSHHPHRYISARLPDGADEPAPRCQTHSIINRSRKPAWLKGFAMIFVSFTVGIYRQKSSLNAGAGYGAICAASTLSALSSIRLHLSALELALERPPLRPLTVASHRVFWPPAQARPEWHRGHAVRSPVAGRLALRQWPLVYEPEVLR